MRAFEVDRDGETVIVCDGCLRSAVSVFAAMPDSAEMRVRVVGTEREAGREACEHCGRDWHSC